MPKRVIVQTELTTEELHDRYRRSDKAVERTHWHILWLLKEGYTPQEIASLLGYTARWVRTIVQRWNRAGEQGIRDRRRTLPGAPSLLTVEQQQELDHALDQPPADGGLWSGPKVAAWMQERLGRPVDPRRGWDYLERLGRSTRVPRPQHAESDEATQQAVKKTPRGGRDAASGVSRSER
jgi:transposase